MPIFIYAPCMFWKHSHKAGADRSPKIPLNIAGSELLQAGSILDAKPKMSVCQQYQNICTVKLNYTVLEDSHRIVTDEKKTYHLELDLNRDWSPFDTCHAGSDNTSGTGNTTQRRTSLQTNTWATDIGRDSGTARCHDEQSANVIPVNPA